MIHILMSTYNGSQYIAEQIESIISQTETEWLLYIRDDGSTDDTRRIIENYVQSDERIRLLPADGKNMRAMQSFIYLLENYGDADYIAFADQDDVWEKNKLQVSIQTIRQSELQYGQTTPIIVHCDLFVVDQQLNLISSSFWEYVNINPDLLDDNIHYLAICNSITGCASLFNRAARNASLPITDKPFMHDAWMGLKVLDSGGKVVAIRQSLIRYRQHNDNVCGAQEYKFRLTNLKEKIRLAKRSYQTGHPLVFHNVLDFMWWKMRYFFALHFRK